MQTLRRGILCCLVGCFIGSAQARPAPVPTSAPSDAQIRKLLVNRIDVEKQGVGIVVAVVDRTGQRIVSYGALEKGDPRPLDGNTLFEIGSITKVFTALLLADMAQRGEVRIDDPIAKYLPSTVKVPERAGRQITLVDLATHTSALPRMPGNFRPSNSENPYADYTEEQLFAFLSSYQLNRDIGRKFEYSNLAFGLLGLGLARHAGVGYEELVEKRIAEPLGMHSTRITLTPELERRFAAGHSSDLVTVSRWDLTSLAGAGALRSSANDMAKFLAAAMGYAKTPLAGAFKTLLSVSRPTGQPFIDSALGWEVDTRGGGEIIWKNGGTGGYRTFIGYSPRSGFGIVALSNASTPSGVDDLGLHLLDARFPLEIPAGSPAESTVDARRLDDFVGHYQLAPTAILSITRDAEQLFAQVTGQPRVAIYPKGDREFFFKVIDAQLTFQTDGDGKTIAVVLHQGGADQTAKRIDAAEADRVEKEVTRRFKEQAAAPGSEAATRRLVAQLQKGQLDYDQFTPDFAVMVRGLEKRSVAAIASFGALQSLAFKGVGPGGADIYELKFDSATVDWRILMASDGKIAGSSFAKKP
jgi:D-alanyl-D-alanine-carboxypeptidase/D-alanyl-D-alanine-endopeptidase